MVPLVTRVPGFCEFELVDTEGNFQLKNDIEDLHCKIIASDSTETLISKLPQSFYK